jgi:hypothetical protein
MQLPAIERLFDEAITTLKRFAWVLLFAAIGTFIGYALINREGHSGSEDLLLGLMPCFLGLPFLVAVRTWCDRKAYSWELTEGLQLGASLLMLGYYLTLPAHVDDLTPVQGYQFAALWLFFHLLVAVAPFIGQHEANGFWQFNKTLFLRFLTSGLYSGVLYLGLALAITAVDKLFNIDFEFRIYGYLFATLAGMFNTWFFLAGVPKDYAALNEDTTYPKGLKIFTQFVLLPIVTIYLVILYAYLLKILFTWHLPNGWVCYLVLCFSVAGILALLLVHPIQFLAENKWIKTYTKWFYIALLPLIVLMSVSIIIRVSTYGITENRYYMLLLAAWLLFTSLYFIFAKAKSIKIIPLSLAILALFSCWGPWGAFSVSARNQYNGLKNALIEAKILVNNKIDTAHGEVSKKLQQRIYTKIKYLHERHDLNVIQPWFDKDIHQLTPDEITYFKDNAANRYALRHGSLDDYVIDYLKVKRFSRSELSENGETTADNVAADESVLDDVQLDIFENYQSALNIKGYDRFQEINIGFGNENEKTTEDVIVKRDTAKKILTLTSSAWGNESIIIDTRPYTVSDVRKISDSNLVARKKLLTVIGETATHRYKVQFKSINVFRENKHPYNIERFELRLLTGEK